MEQRWFYALYQAGGPILGAGESWDEALLDARQWGVNDNSEQTDLLDEEGRPLLLSHFVVHEAIPAIQDIPGRLYLRMCSKDVAEDVEHLGSDNVAYHIDTDGRLQLGAKV